MTSNSLTAIVARDFRGTTLFLKSFTEAHSTFIWSKNRMDAESFPVAQAVAIIRKAHRDWGAEAYAIDSAGEILKPRNVHLYNKASQAHAAQFENLAMGKPVSRTETREFTTLLPETENVHCLIFEHPSRLGDYVLVLNSRCKSAEETRTFLSDRIANGQAFSSERCATMPLSEYERRNSNGGI